MAPPATEVTEVTPLGDDPDVIDPNVMDPAATERWFLDRGVPHFIVGYSASRDVFTRTLPALTLVFLLEMFGALNLDWVWWANVLAAAGGLAVLVAVWAMANRLQRRPAFARPASVGKYELTVFVAGPALLPLLFGGQLGSALGTAVFNLVLLGGIYLVTSYALVPLTRWALTRMQRQLAAVVGLLARALPLVLLFVTFLFLTAEVWEVAADLDGLALGLVIGLFFVAGTAFLVGRIPREIAALEPTPPLRRRERGNLALLLLFTQGVQVIIVSATIGLFFVAFGVLTVSEHTASTWSAITDIDVLARFTLGSRELVLTAELLRVCGFLAAFTGFYFTVYLLTDQTYRREFFEEVVVEIQEVLAVRSRYLAALGSAA